MTMQPQKKQGGGSIIGIFANLAEAYLDPRKSAARIVAMKLSLSQCLSMMLLAVALQLILQAVFVPQMEQSVFEIAGSFVAAVMNYFMLVFIAQAVATNGFAGTGSLQETAAGIAWYNLVTVFLAPLLFSVMVQAEDDGSAPLILLLMFAAGTIYSIYISACFLSVIHGFRNLFAAGVISMVVQAVVGLIATMLLSVIFGSPV